MRWMVKKLMKAICYSSGCGLHWANGLAFLWYISIQERVWDHEEENYEYEDCESLLPVWQLQVKCISHLVCDCCL